MIVICLNPALDLIGRTDYLVRGEVNRINTLGIYPGGKGINIVKVLRDLLPQQQIVISGFLGKNNKDLHCQLLNKKQISDEFIYIDGNIRTNVKITDNKLVTDLNFQGFTVNKNNIQNLFDKCEKLLKSIWLDKTFVVINGSLPDGFNLKNFDELLQLFKNYNKKIIIDTVGEPLKIAIKNKPFLIKPNKFELENYCKKQLNSTDEILLVANNLLNFGIENIIVSCGENGAFWINNDSIYHAYLEPVKSVISTVGAGDSMLAAIIYGFLKKLHIEENFRISTAVAYNSITSLSLDIEDTKYIVELAGKVNLKKVK